MLCPSAACVRSEYKLRFQPFNRCSAGKLEDAGGIGCSFSRIENLTRPRIGRSLVCQTESGLHIRPTLIV